MAYEWQSDDKHVKLMHIIKHVKLMTMWWQYNDILKTFWWQYNDNFNECNQQWQINAHNKKMPN